MPQFTSHFIIQFLSLPSQKKTDFHALFATILNQIPCQNEVENCLKTSFLTESKQQVLNHAFDLFYFSSLMRQEILNLEIPSSPFTLFLQDVLQGIDELQTHRDSADSPLPVNKSDLELRFSRYLESKITTSLLTTPIEPLKNVINKISYDILLSIYENRHNLDEDELNSLYRHFLFNLGASLTEPNHPNLDLAFGRFPVVPDLKDVCQVLKEGVDLPRIMLIHFMFMRDVNPRASNAMEGDFTLSTETVQGNFTRLSNENTPHSHRFFCDYTYYAPHLYTDRGRNRFTDITSQHLGIMLTDEDRKTFPTRDTAWCPDCLCNEPDLASIYVRTLTKHEIPYVSGPSGMTSIFSGLMTYYGDLTLAEKEIYSLAVVAFIGGGGLHSIHEILTVLTVRLGLINGYQSFGPEQGNYYDYFEAFLTTIPSLSAVIENAWKESLTWYQGQFPQQCDSTVYQSPHKTSDFHP